jgi:hypothetical protein
MATLPIVDKNDRQKGIIAAFVVLTIAFIVLQFISFTLADPRPQDIVLKMEALPETIIELKTFETQGGGSGNPTKAELVNKVTPQMEKNIRDKNSKTKEQEAKGESDHSNQNKSSDNKSTTTVNSDLLFKKGGSGGGDDAGKGKGFGNDEGDGAGPGNGEGKKPRIRLNDPNTENISSDQSCKIALKLTINAEGDVIKGENLTSKTTTTNQIVINQVIANVKSQVKYNKVSGSAPEIVYLTVNIAAR